MKLHRRHLLLYAVTDRAWTGHRTLLEQVEAALRGGATMVQLREKTLDEAAFLREAVEMARCCKAHGVPFIVNDNVDVALQSGADGVHLGQGDQAPREVRRRVGEDFIIGVSAHTQAEAVEAQRNGADYLGVGAVFGTATKRDVTAMSYDRLKAICAAVDIPVVAIGGITKDNVTRLSGSGVDGVAVVSALFAEDDPQAAAARLLTLAKEVAGVG